jgi:hypothetical protein
LGGAKFLRRRPAAKLYADSIRSPMHILPLNACKAWLLTLLLLVWMDPPAVAQDFRPSLSREWSVVPELGLKLKQIDGMELKESGRWYQMKEGKLLGSNPEGSQLSLLRRYSSATLFEANVDGEMAPVEYQWCVISMADTGQGWAKDKDVGIQLKVQELCRAYLEKSNSNLFLATEVKRKWRKFSDWRGVEFQFEGNAQGKEFPTVQTPFQAYAWVLDLPGEDLALIFVGPNSSVHRIKKSLAVIKKIPTQVRFLTLKELESYAQQELLQARGDRAQRQWSGALRIVGPEFGGSDQAANRGKIVAVKMPKPALVAVQAGSDWLLRVQAEEGYWSSQLANEKRNSFTDIGVTGLAGRALLAGHSRQPNADIQAAVQAAALWISAQQNEQGLFGEQIGQATGYNHAIACQFMLDMHQSAGWNSAAQKQSIQASLNLILASQNLSGGWDYGFGEKVGGPGKFDPSLSSWCLLVLIRGQQCGFQVDPRVLQKAGRAFANLADEAGRFGYDKPGGLSSRFVGQQEKFPPSNTEALTGLGLYCSLLVDSMVPQSHQLSLLHWRSLNILMELLPSANAKFYDLYYWRIASSALAMMGDAEAKAWREALLEVLLKKQVRPRNNPDAGAWPATSVWSSSGGQAFATSMAILSLVNAYAGPQLN